MQFRSVSVRPWVLLVQLHVYGLWSVLAASLPAVEPPPAEDVEFTATHDGSTQRYVVLYPEGFRKDRPSDLLIALHGHGSDRWQFVRSDRDECRAARDVAAKHEMLFVSPDYRTPTSWMGPKAEADLLQIIAELRSKFPIRSVILSGASMGGSSALTFAALHPDQVDGVVSMNGTANHLEYENFQDAIADSFGGNKRELVHEYKKRSAEYWPEQLTMPVALTVGGRDEIVPPDSVRRLASVLKKIQPEVFLLDRVEGDHSTNYEDARAAFDFVLNHAKKRSDANTKHASGK